MNDPQLNQYHLGVQSLGLSQICFGDNTCDTLIHRTDGLKGKWTLGSEIQSKYLRKHISLDMHHEPGGVSWFYFVHNSLYFFIKCCCRHKHMNKNVLPWVRIFLSILILYFSFKCVTQKGPNFIWNPFAGRNIRTSTKTDISKKVLTTTRTFLQGIRVVIPS